MAKLIQDNGDRRKKDEWEKKLMFHKKWSRKDVEIKNVELDIVGIKRVTTHIPAGVLINNIKFS